MLKLQNESAFLIGYGGLQSKCPTAPKAPENCEEKTEIYTRGCLTGYECKSWKRGIRDGKKLIVFNFVFL